MPTLQRNTPSESLKNFPDTFTRAKPQEGKVAIFQRQILDIYYRTLYSASKLEHGEGLLGAGRLGHLQGVVLHSLVLGPASAM